MKDVLDELAAGGEPEHVAAAVEATTKFYVPDPT
jgi:hypothetical protein